MNAQLAQQATSIKQHVPKTSADFLAGTKKLVQKQPAPLLNKPPAQIGIYKVGERLGEGASAKVFKAFNSKTGEVVAIKIFKDENLKEVKKQQIQMEINLLKKLEHGNIVKYIDTIQQDKKLTIIMEYVENGSLDKVVKSHGPLNEELTSLYVKQVLQGLDYLHSQGVIHRDIKGGNILTTKDARVKLADFGVATKLNDNEGKNSIVGTPYWMAPEIIDASGQATSACDIWSVACTIIELLTSKPPFQDHSNTFAAMRSIVNDTIPLPENISEDLTDFLTRCFEKDPFKRIDAKSLLQHSWIKKYEESDSSVLSSFSAGHGKHELPNNSQDEIDPRSKSNQSQPLREPRVNINVSQSNRQQSPRVLQNQNISQARRHQEIEEDDPGEIGELGEEQAMNEPETLAIEQPKALSKMNNNDGGFQQQQHMRNQGSSGGHQSRRITSNIQDGSQQQVLMNNRPQQITLLNNELNYEPQIIYQPSSSNQINAKPKSIQNSKSSGMIQMQQFPSGQIISSSIDNRPNTGAQQQQFFTQIPQTSPGGHNQQAQTFMMRQAAAQNAAQIQLQQQKQIFDVQGNRKIYYNARKNNPLDLSQQHQLGSPLVTVGGGGGPQPEQFTDQQLMHHQQRRGEHIRQTNKLDGISPEELAELQYQQMYYQQQQKGMISKYHQAAAQQQQPMSTGGMMVQTQFGLQGVHVHPKAKSNDMLGGANAQHIRYMQQQTGGQIASGGEQIMVPNHQQQIVFAQNIGQPHLVTQYQSVQQQQQFNRNDNSQPRYTMLASDYQQQYLLPQSAKSAQITQIIQPQQQTSYGSRMLRQQQVLENSGIGLRNVSPMSAGASQGMRYNQMYNQNIHQSQERKSSLPTQVLLSVENALDSEPDLTPVMNENQHHLYNQQQTSGQSRQLPHVLLQSQNPHFHTTSSNQRNEPPAILDQQQHSRIGSYLVSRVNEPQTKDRNALHKTAISSTFQGASSPKTQTNVNAAADQCNAVDSSFDNYYESLSNNCHPGKSAMSPREQTAVNLVHQKQMSAQQNASNNGVQANINMQAIKNVRDSFMKRGSAAPYDLTSSENSARTRLNVLQEQRSENGGGSNQSKRRQSNSNAVPALAASGTGLMQQLQSHNHLQSIGSGRSHYSNSTKLHSFFQVKSPLFEGTPSAALLTSRNIQDESGQLLLQIQSLIASEIGEGQNPTDNDSLLALSIKKLTIQLRDYPTEPFKDQIVQTFSYTTLLSLVKDSSEELSYQAMQLINQICEGSSRHLEVFSMCGYLTHMMKLGSINANQPREVIVEVAFYIGQIFQQSTSCLQMFLANDGLKLLVEFLEYEYNENKDIVFIAIDSFLVFFQILENLTLPPIEDLCLVACRSGLLKNLTTVLVKILQSAEQDDTYEGYLDKAFEVLQGILASSTTLEIKRLFCQEMVFKSNIHQLLYKTISEPSVYTLDIIKRFIKIMQTLTQVTQLYQEFEKYETVKLLVEIMQILMSDKDNLQLASIYDNLKLINALCKMSPERTEQAALGSVIAPIKDLIGFLLSNNELSRSKRNKLLKYTLSIIQELIEASTITRQLLSGCQIQMTLLQIIQQTFTAQAQHQAQAGSSKDQTIHAKILDLYVLWLETEPSQIDNFLSKRTTLETIFNIFVQTPRTKVFLFVFNALNRMLSRSPLITKSLASQSALVDKLAGQLKYIESQLASQPGGVHHNKNRESARSMNEIMNNQQVLNTLEDNNANNDNLNSRSSQQAQIMKELMDIFTSLVAVQKEPIMERQTLGMLMLKIYNTAEQSNLVIIQSMAQNILQSIGFHQGQQQIVVTQTVSHQQKQIPQRLTGVHHQQTKTATHMSTSAHLPHHTTSMRTKSPNNFN